MTTLVRDAPFWKFGEFKKTDALEMNASQAKMTSTAFYIASERCLTECRIDSWTQEIILIPGIVNALFSIELGFKAIIMHEGGNSTGHKLHPLFLKMSHSAQNDIIKVAGLDRDHFLVSLAAISDAYVQWRYHYEHIEITISLSFLDSLAKSTQHVLANTVGT